MNRATALRMRLAVQRLTSAPLASVTEVVRSLCCVQSQERDHAMYSLGLRSRTPRYQAVRDGLDAGAFIRTHILRPTWHFVAAEDLRWILALTSPRVLAGMQARDRQLGLDGSAALDAGFAVLADLLAGRNYLTRTEIGRVVATRGGPVVPGEQLGHLLLVAELRGLLCSGPTKRSQHSYALVDERVPVAAARSREEALAELARRFFTGHGPATVHDFTRWSSLTVTDTRAALDQLGDELTRVEIDGVAHWLGSAPSPRAVRGRSAFLLPVYDEAVLTNPGLTFPPAPGHPAPRPDPFWAPVVADGQNVGGWKRTVGAKSVAVTLDLAPSVTPGATVPDRGGCSGARRVLRTSDPGCSRSREGW